MNIRKEHKERSLAWFETARGNTAIGLRLEKALADADIATILDRLVGRYAGDEYLSEGRSTVLPSDSALLYDGLKVKGAGLCGDIVEIGRRHTGAFDLPYYDFEGNYTPDRSRAHQAAYAGGMSYQQAVNEYRVSRYLTDNGFDTYPPIGYGYLRKDGLTSWFCLLNAPFKPCWKWNAPDFDAHLVQEVPRFIARTQNEMKELGLQLVLHGVENIDGRLVRKDFHSVRFVERNDSFISRICYFFFDINFVLYTLAHPVYETGIPGWVERAWCDYIDELCSSRFDFGTIQMFKETLVKLKLDDRATLDERMEIIRSDSVARGICGQFMTEQERRQFL